MTSLLTNYRIWAYLLFFAVLLALPLTGDDFWLNRVAKYLCFGMLGAAIALTWGYAGVLNLGQGLFFGLGAYAMAMPLKLASYTSLQQGSDQPVPDFMLWNAQPGASTDLCCITPGSWLWIPFQSQWFGVAMAIIAPVIVATLLGRLIFGQRISGVFVSIITLALVLLARLLLVDAQPLTNGFNGLTDLGYFNLFGTELDPYAVTTYYVITIALIVVLVLARLLVATRAGTVLQATRDSQTRALYLGYDVPAYQTFFFAVSAAISGLAGMLYVVVAEFASPSFLDLTFSVSMVVWAAVGGRGSILGACIGAILINVLEARASETEALVEAWKAIVGLVFVLVVIWLPQGLGGFAHDMMRRLTGRWRPEALKQEVRQ
ncbi:amino acid/amide ABC transporter membrane protein 2 (HAAT family) [Gemmobacter caeni]|uniref:Amino acid/amide ABC transporter membrane protein 2 (HAAT family) n=1 Tax=Gemmobacter caeni TaxID=589035 RepID=A0A2T6B3J6_9RHOB|nr:urea ABC transporter permease subunit UrtC [Gemmobacter caeni]PTX50605.1 amino acid/amide ABC transporter membrane protein 2 (HAAT family) [Gemmobacter caeni]TWI94656.1 amino acid/amide ABC transporter membrane protein 2 (HAAT family) [Gemmobacter caeni]